MIQSFYFNLNTNEVKIIDTYYFDSIRKVEFFTFKALVYLYNNSSRVFLFEIFDLQNYNLPNIYTIDNNIVKGENCYILSPDLNTININNKSKALGFMNYNSTSTILNINLFFKEVNL